MGLGMGRFTVVLVVCRRLDHFCAHDLELVEGRGQLVDRRQVKPSEV